MKKYWEILKATFKEWQEDHASRLAAALSYYTIFSIAPLLIIAIGIATMVFGDRAETQIQAQIQGMVGETGAEAIAEMLKNARRESSGLVPTLIGGGLLIFGASCVFRQLKDALNTIWDVERKGGGIKATIIGDFLSFTMVLGIGFLLMVSLAVSAVISGFSEYIAGSIPGGAFVAQLINIALSFGVFTLLFALIYKILPDVEIEWRDVWVGAAVTSLLFAIGKYLIGLYLGHSSTASTFGAFGSLVVLLVWIYYSAQLLFFGAEFTQVWARQHGRGIQPSPAAVPLDPAQKVTQGMASANHVAAVEAVHRAERSRQARIREDLKVRPLTADGKKGKEKELVIIEQKPGVDRYAVGLLGLIFGFLVAALKGGKKQQDF